jgi:hypothetical protein
MDDHLVTTDTQSGLIVTHGVPISSLTTENVLPTSNDGSILDLSQRPTTETINNWNNDIPCTYSDSIDDDLNRILIINKDQQFNLEQSLTDQLKDPVIKEDSLSDNSKLTQSKIDFYSSIKKPK